MHPLAFDLRPVAGGGDPWRVHPQHDVTGWPGLEAQGEGAGARAGGHGGNRQRIVGLRGVAHLGQQLTRRIAELGDDELHVGSDGPADEHADVGKSPGWWRSPW